jgi:hypothetical protein
LSRQPITCFFTLVLAGILIRLLLLPVMPIPTPLIHDEFSYLLAGNTFSIGRLTNPQPPVPAAFEAFHINLWPTYQSMYMPGVGLFLAAGFLLGNPWIGVLLATSIFCGLIYLTVAGWLARPYALGTGILALSICLNWNWWFDNYFCIAAQGIGGALVVGSVPRILRRRRWLATVPFGLGCIILMMTRPYEGALIAIPCTLGLLWQLRRISIRQILLLSSAPSLLLVLAMSWLFYYNWRSTGNPLLMPYKVNYLQYHITGPFIFSSMRHVPLYHHEQMGKAYMEWEMKAYRLLTNSPSHFMMLKPKIYYHTFLRGCGLLFLVGLFSVWRTKGFHWILVFTLFTFALGTLLVAWYPVPQYGAPAAGLFFLLIAYGFFRIHRMQGATHDGTKLLSGFLFAQVVLSVCIFFQNYEHSFCAKVFWYAEVERPRIEQLLLNIPGNHLVLVRYAEDHPAFQEWVYNQADLYNSRIVWARSMDPEDDRKLIAAFPKRQLWLLEPDNHVRNLSPYHLVKTVVALEGR